jgi:GT2 family glycosyltransferase
MQNKKLAVVIPCWNNIDIVADAVDSLLAQSIKLKLIVVENGSEDGSGEFLKKKYGSKIVLLENQKNLGFAGGVNTGIRWALEEDFEYIGLFNTDARADVKWAESLIKLLEKDEKIGAAAGKILRLDGKHFDTAGDLFYSWGVFSPRGRDSLDKGQYEEEEEIFSACAGASIYRSAMFKDVGLFDEDLFAYYEDGDISFRARNYGWKILYMPKAVTYHEVGGSSKKVSGFAMKMSLRNQILVLVKNVPLRYYIPLMFRFKFLWLGGIIHAFKNKAGKEAVWAVGSCALLLPKKFMQRLKIQHIRRKRGIKPSEIRKLWVEGLPKEMAEYTTIRVAKKIVFWER